MSEPHKFSYQTNIKDKNFLEPMPYLDVLIERENLSKQVFGLLDSGATVNVLPFQIGIELGAVWENQTTKLKLGGNLANSEARGLILTARVAEFEPIKLAFAWTKNENIPVILGQTNFFMEFDVCFFRSQGFF